MKNNSSVDRPEERTWAKWMAIAGLLLIVAATAMPLLRVEGDAFRYVYSVGAVFVLAGRAFNTCPYQILRVKRLYRIEVWAGIIFCVGAFFMFYKGAGRMDWMAFTLAGGIIEAYASIMIPRAAEGAKKNKRD